MTTLTLQDFLTYIHAFNAQNYTLQHTFYHRTVSLTLPDPDIPPLKSSPAIQSHYDTIHALAHETVVPMIVLIDANRVFFSMEAYFQYRIDTDNAVHGYSVKAGDVIRVKVWAVYEIVEGKMGAIVCCAVGDECLGKVEIGDVVAESWGRADESVRSVWEREFGEGIF
ncbi:uncharacterized protein N7496_008421 [Penicillium cataractarum]|uniref:Uncharacterized protein n=1 Tax=Penicillium cataractarum TaxID=2100454 RepID=A0A9W9RYQ2_9EURO|nr:uncharacterized protein N7496_008421 [Penicillium cataractarum]KAJ5368661.1 hypothetical protein N7496_008421 [Penicillium cataractarum]